MEKQLRGSRHKKPSVTKSLKIVSYVRSTHKKAMSVWQEDSDPKNLAKTMRILDQESPQLAFELFKTLSRKKHLLKGRASHLYYILHKLFRYLRPRDLWMADEDTHEGKEGVSLSEMTHEFNDIETPKKIGPKESARSTTGTPNRILTRAAKKRLRQKAIESAKASVVKIKQDMNEIPERKKTVLE